MTKKTRPRTLDAESRAESRREVVVWFCACGVRLLGGKFCDQEKIWLTPRNISRRGSQKGGKCGRGGSAAKVGAGARRGVRAGGRGQPRSKSKRGGWWEGPGRRGASGAFSGVPAEEQPARNSRKPGIEVCIVWNPRNTPLHTPPNTDSLHQKNCFIQLGVLFSFRLPKAYPFMCSIVRGRLP